MPPPLTLTITDAHLLTFTISKLLIFIAKKGRKINQRFSYFKKFRNKEGLFSRVKGNFYCQINISFFSTPAKEGRALRIIINRYNCKI